ncbi:MAG TPA: isoprenylcysteine carboxylmethyltransferase family protein [Pseudolabrys sp.]|nr:isoprenylcysteine carboxylmethyltransferase family protein [Pseudolabrys sp.]
MPDNAGVLVPPPLIAAGVIVIGLLLDWVVPINALRAVLPTGPRMVVGIIVAASGLALLVPAMRSFRYAGTNPEPWKPSISLVTVGIFAWMRNPMYVGGILLLAGLAVLLASDWILVMTILSTAVLHFGVVTREERYLETKFGEVYRRYREQVPRYGWPRR